MESLKKVEKRPQNRNWGKAGKGHRYKWSEWYGKEENQERIPWTVWKERRHRKLKLEGTKANCVVLSHIWLFSTLCSLPGFSVPGVLQARILEWVTMPSSRGSPPPRDQTHVSLAGRFFTTIFIKIQGWFPQPSFTPIESTSLHLGLEVHILKKKQTNKQKNYLRRGCK